MLTVDLLAENHRRIYEAVRDAGKPISPKEIEDATGLPGSTVRPTLGVMLQKGLLARPLYGLYTVVPLDQVGDVAEDPDAVAIEALSALVHMMPDAVCLLDEELRFIAYNEAYLRLWQVERDDITGLSMYDVFPDVSPEGRVRIQRVLAGESIYLGEPEPYTWRRADDSVWWCRLRMFPWRRDRDNSVGGMVVICAASMSPDDVPHIGMVPIEKSASGGEILPDSGVDRSTARGYDSGSLHSQGEDMQLPIEFVTSMAAAAVAVAIDPEAFRDITQKMMRKGRYRLRIIAEPVDKEPPPPKG